MLFSGVTGSSSVGTAGVNFQMHTDYSDWLGTDTDSPHLYVLNNTTYYLIINGIWFTMNTGAKAPGQSDPDAAMTINGSTVTGPDTDHRFGFTVAAISAPFNPASYSAINLQQSFNSQQYGELVLIDGASNSVLFNSEYVSDVSYSPGTTELPLGRYLLSGSKILNNTEKNHTLVPQDKQIKSLYGYNHFPTIEFFKNWNSNTISYANQINTGSNATFISNIGSKSNFTAPMTIDGISQTESTIKLYDPWYLDPVDGVQKGSVGREMSTFQNSTANVFKNIEINSTAPYELQLSSVDNIGNPIYYINHSVSNITAPVFSTTNKFKVRFDGADNQLSSVSVNFKGHLRTAQSNNAYSKNQRRFAVNGNNQILVYESMGDIWVTTSTNGGTIWSPEKRLSVRQGFAKNPTLSNVLSNGKVVISWQETNVSGTEELHLQTYNIANVNPFGWSSPSSTQTSSNHQLASAFGFSVPGIGAYPTVYLENASKLDLAFKNNSGISSGQISIPADLGTAALSGSIRGMGDYTSKYPTVLYLPSVNGSSAKTYVYYTSEAGNGEFIYQYDYSSGANDQVYLPSVLTGTGTYTCLGLQAAVSNSTVVLAYHASAASGTDVLYYGKPIYNSIPQFYQRYPKAKNPAISNTSGSPYSSGVQLYFRSTDTSSPSYFDYWFLATGGTTATPTQSQNATGFFTKEVSGSSSDFNHYFVTNETLGQVKKLNNSGGLNKNNSSAYMFNVIANRFWISGEDTNQTVLDFSGAEIEIIRENQIGSLVLSAKINSISESGLIVTQPDSLLTPLSVELVHNGEVVRSYSVSEWDALSQSSIPDLQEGDVLNFRIQNGAFLFGYEDMILVNKGSGLNKRLGSNSKGSVLKVSDLQISAYPNPFNPQTTFKITIPNIQFVTLEVYNMLGQKVQTLANGKLEAGEHNFQFNGTTLATGTYIYRLTANDKVQSGKIVLMK